jgi:hypothetical protein
MHTNIRLDEIPEDKILIYDIETDCQFAPYAVIRMIGCRLGFKGKKIWLRTKEEFAWFKKLLKDPTVFKFGWNSKSFDDIVLHRHGFEIPEENSHDLMLALKAINPMMPSYSLKFSAWYYFDDPHWPEFELERWAQKTGNDKWTAPDELLVPYCLHDIEQTTNLLGMIWDNVIKPKHWDAYLLDLSQGEPVKEMELEGGIYLNAADLTAKIATLQYQKLGWEQKAWVDSGHRVQNPNSPKQLGAYLNAEGFELDLTDSGEFSVPKSLLLDLIDMEDPTKDVNPVARASYEIRKIQSALKYYENYLEALTDETYAHRPGWIPVQYSISNARTRRYTSNSKYKLNFQNPNHAAKAVQLVPEGWLGVWIDSTQVENVVHIYESEDWARRHAYEADAEWNEYVWLCNRILGGERTKKELDAIQSEQIPNWSIYKQFKTVKLALNFGMGVAKFCSSCGVDSKTGKRMFDLVHDACPAIRSLQDKVSRELTRYGYVRDTFGHIYSGDVRKAYKVVAYLIQGCGTGSLPKAQIRANYDTLRELKTKRGSKLAMLCGTCHDESGLRLSLGLEPDRIIATLQKLMYNMTDKFSPMFDNIPLRAKLYLSRTTADEAEEVSINDTAKIRSYLN